MDLKLKSNATNVLDIECLDRITHRIYLLLCLPTRGCESFTSKWVILFSNLDSGDRLKNNIISCAFSSLVLPTMSSLTSWRFETNGICIRTPVPVLIAYPRFQKRDNFLSLIPQKMVHGTVWSLIHQKHPDHMACDPWYRGCDPRTHPSCPWSHPFLMPHISLRPWIIKDDTDNMTYHGEGTFT